MEMFKATELRLGLPGSYPFPEKPPSPSKISTKRASQTPEHNDSASSTNSSGVSDPENGDLPPSKTQIVGWPPVRSCRKHIGAQSSKIRKTTSDDHESDESLILYVKVSMDGAPFLRKIDLKLYKSYLELIKALQIMFKITIGDYTEREGYNGSDYVPTYEDKDGDWMLVGDVPWEMFISSCKRLRIMKSSEAKGLGWL